MEKSTVINMRYGTNPNQTRAKLLVPAGDPLEILNGAPSYINAIDALNSWQLVRELKAALDLPAAASFKHTSPAGAAIGLPLNEALKGSYFTGDIELSPLACAYARARGADRLSSMGDFIALSDVCDVPTAMYIAKEVSDGIIAPGYEPVALEILSRKKQGKYLVMKMDPGYEPPIHEQRQIFGFMLGQDRNTVVIDSNVMEDKFIVTESRELPVKAVRDLIVACVTLKYTQSNSICFAYDGQAIGVGAGQQSRIQCTKIALAKAKKWWLRQHPKILALIFNSNVNRAEINNAIDLFLDNEAYSNAAQMDSAILNWRDSHISDEEKEEWISKLKEVSLASDAFFPFGDCLREADGIGVKYVVQPGGSSRDDQVITTANRYNMTMLCNGIRLFHH